MRKHVSGGLILAAAVLAAGSGCARQETAPAVTAAESAAETLESAPESTQAAESLPAGQEEGQTGERWTEEYSAAYLKYYFDVELTGENVTAEEFAEALLKVAGEQETTEEEQKKPAEAPVADTPLDSIKAAVAAADYEELALSYPAAKAQERLAVHGVDYEDGAYAAYLACALDTELIDAGEAKAAVSGEAMTAAEAAQLLMAVADANGDGSNYLGMSDDPDIYGKLDHAWNEFIIFDDPELTEIGKQAVFNGTTTGYGIKSDAYSARFLPELTL
ncbi:MAG: hypothetical protein Q4C73_07820 [Eubacteriales bacterium]|nr:hypothetical protein [Eubacteriales bacterium]